MHRCRLGHARKQQKRSSSGFLVFRKNVFSFQRKDVCKELKLEVLVGSFKSCVRDSRAVILSKPVYKTIRKHVGDKNHQVVVYVLNKKVASGLDL